MLFFYVLVPVPTIISRRMASSFDSASSACVELCIFLTTGIVISALGLPLILARASVVSSSYNINVRMTQGNFFDFWGFPIISDINQPVHSQKIARRLKFWMRKN